MTNYFNPIKAGLHMEKCFTFYEVAEICKPLLGEKCLIEFMQEIGYLNVFLLPEKEYIWKDMFEIVHLENKEAGSLSKAIDFYLTNTGLVSIFRKALKYYLSERMKLGYQEKDLENLQIPLKYFSF